MLDQSDFAAWLNTQPQDIKDMAHRYDPFLLYRDLSTGKLGQIVGYNQDGTLMVAFTRRHNNVLMQTLVNDFPPSDLVIVGPLDSEEHTLSWPDDIADMMDSAEANLSVMLDSWHKDPNAPPPGLRRAMWIRERISIYERELLARIRLETGA